MIVSVPHAGNRFARSLVGHGHKIVHSYDYRRFYDLLDPILVPLRDPLSVWMSWCARPQNPEILDPDHPRSFEAAWRGLSCLSRSGRKLFFLPVDCAEHREQALLDIAEAVGLKLTTDWQPVGRSGSEPALLEKDLSWIYALPFMREFY